MIIAFDASVLLFLFEKDAHPPQDPTTGAPLEGCYERVNHLVATLERDRATIIVPTPALGEILVKAGQAGPEWLRILEKSSRIQVVSFDQMAAVEYAAMQAERVRSGGKASGGRAKAKFDDQIIAIARVCGAQIIYSDDHGLAAAAGSRLQVTGLANMPLPPVDPQLPLALDASRNADEAREGDESRDDADDGSTS